MDVTPLIRAGAQIAQSYANGIFKISGQIYKTPIIVTPERTIPWDVQGFDGLRAEDFAPPEECDVMLLGTGKTMRLIGPELRKSLKEKGLHIDPMDTGAACRTYNVLMAEGRRVAAFLLPG